MSSKLAKSKIREFLGEDVGSGHPIQHLKETLSDLAIFGGMIRDLALGNVESFRSDIDLVSTSSAEEIYSLIKNYDPVRNRFGGFRFFFLGRPYDIWSLEDTWAVREGYVKALQLKDLCKTTFFTVDAALFDVKNERFYAPEFCWSSIKSKVLGINLIHNPFPEKMAIKAVSLSLRQEFKLSYELCEFVLMNDICKGVSDLYFSSLNDHVRVAPGKVFEFSRQLQLNLSN